MPVNLVVAFAAAVTASTGSASITLSEESSRHGSFSAVVTVVPLAFSSGDTPPTAFRTVEFAPDVAKRRIGVSLSPGVWRVAIASTDRWAAPQDVVVTAGQETTVQLPLLPKSRLVGRLARRPTEPLRELRATIQSPPAARPQIPRTVIKCPIDDGAWHCTIPAGTLDVEIGAPGYISAYRWDVPAPIAGTADVGQIVLRRGASVFGSVITLDGRPARAGTRVTLLADDGACSRPSAPGKPRTPEPWAATNRRGFYHIRDTPPGRYLLVAEQPGFAQATAFVEVIKDVTSKVAPLKLHLAENVEVALDPPVDASRTPWQIELVREGSDGPAIGPSPATLAGTWRHSGLSPGTYWLTVQDTGGRRWLNESIQVPTAGPLSMRIPVRQVSGELSLGGSPLMGTVIFGGRHGAVTIPFEADEDGRFGGQLPEEPIADAHGWLVRIESEEPYVRRTLQRVTPIAQSGDVSSFEIRLPETSLDIRVVDEAGRPMKGLIHLQNLMDAEGLLQSWTDEGGRLQLNGLPSGEVRLSAQSADRLSEEIRLDLTPDTRQEVRLVARKERRLSARVINADAEAIPAASIRMIAFGHATVPRPTLTTDRDGRFELPVPAGAGLIGLNVGAVGYAFKNFLVDTNDGRPLSLALTKESGRLVLEYSRVPATDAKTPRAYLLHHGSFEGVDALLARWAAVNGSADLSASSAPGTFQEPVTLTVPQMAPGDYALCRLTPRDVVTLLPGQMANDCSFGRLHAGSELRLRAVAGERGTLGR